MGESARMIRTLTLASPRDTERLGAALARSCPWSARETRVIHLSGPIGAGKTLLAAAMLAALGVRETVRSPTYALLEVYALPAGSAVHLDLYRLEGSQELEPLGLRDYLTGNALMLIEWPERAITGLPPADIALALEPQPVTPLPPLPPPSVPQDSPQPARLCRLEAHTPAGSTWLSALGDFLPGDCVPADRLVSDRS